MIYEPSNRKGRSMIESVEHEMGVRYPLVDKVRKRGSVKEWNCDLKELLYQNLSDASPPRMFICGGRGYSYESDVCFLRHCAVRERIESACAGERPG